MAEVHASLAKALALELRDPIRALEIYGEVERKNHDRQIDLLVVAAVCPPLAISLSLLVVPQFLAGTPRNIASYLVVLLLGYLPAIEMYRRRSPREFSRVSTKEAWIQRAIAAVLFLYLDLLIFSFLVLLAGLIAAVVILPLRYLRGGLLTNSLPLYIELPIKVLAFVVTVAWGFTPRPLSAPRRSLPEIAVDLRLESREIVAFAVRVMVGLETLRPLVTDLLGSAVFEISTGFATGVPLGLTLYRPQRDRTLGRIIALGRARALLKLGRVYEARHHIHAITALSGFPRSVGEMADVLDDLASQNRARVRAVTQPLSELYRDARDRVAVDMPWHDAWLAGVRNTIALTSFIV